VTHGWSNTSGRAAVDSLLNYSSYRGQAKPGRGGSRHELTKPLKGIQLVKSKPGQSRSGRPVRALPLVGRLAGSDSVGSEDAGREGKLRNRYRGGGSSPLAWRKETALDDRYGEVVGSAGVPSRGTPFTRDYSQEPGETSRLLPYTSRQGALTATGPGPRWVNALARGTKRAFSGEVAGVEGDRRRPGRQGESLRPRSKPDERGELGRARDPREEGGNSRVPVEGDMTVLKKIEQTCQRDSTE